METYWEIWIFKKIVIVIDFKCYFLYICISSQASEYGLIVVSCYT